MGTKKTERRVRLRVEGGFPLSWCSEDIVSESGRQLRAQTVGRRVWGPDIGKPMWLLKAVDGGLGLFDVSGVHPRAVQRFEPPEGYDSPWHSDCVQHAIRVAQWHEEQKFNASLEGGAS